ncbi:MAG: 4Fe-4S dicluster domain-containing protein [Methanomassiliicoccales archaeon]
MEGYGFPVVDGDKCMGCGACALNCPESVMQMEDHEGTRSFSHYQYNCRTCRICEEVCPNEAIEIRSGFELSLFLSGEGVKDVDLRMRRCGNCGEFYSADLQLEDIQRRLASGSEDGLIALDLPRELFELCPRCRRDRAAKMVKRRNNKEPMEETAILED